LFPAGSLDGLLEWQRRRRVAISWLLPSSVA